MIHIIYGTPLLKGNEYIYEKHYFYNMITGHKTTITIIVDQYTMTTEYKCYYKYSLETCTKAFYQL